MLEPQAKTQQLYLLLCTHSCKGLCHRINFGLTVITAVTQSESVKAAFQQSAPQCKYDIGDIQIMQTAVVFSPSALPLSEW